ncbi:MAG: hypothetical protein K2X25_07225 [Caulobacteraceae bacterium]|nr:hypothetical protein [Caulobacteraceae bacterium]
MTDQPIDPAATPKDDDAPEIAADDAGATALAERMGNAHSPITAEPVEDEDEEGLDGEGV